MKARRFKFEYEKCLGCQACVLACKQQNNTQKSQGLRRLRAINPSRHQGLPAYHLSMACNHCKDPKCMEVCEAHAIEKRKDGPVVLHQSICNGCKMCVGACPYDAITYNHDNDKINKCNMCIETLGSQEVPFCVSSCPTGALSVVDDCCGNDTEHALDRILKDMDKRIGGKHHEV